MLMFVEMKRQIRLAVSAPVGGQLLHDRRDVVRAFRNKAWRESEDPENVYVCMYE
jgi:hypothetical protein